MNRFEYGWKLKSAIWCRKYETCHANSIGPAPCFAATKSWKSGKTPKCTKNDQFRQIDFLNTVYFHSSYTLFDVELHVEFFELVFMFVTRVVPELLTKNRSKTRRRNFADPMASEKALSPGHSHFDQIVILKIIEKK